MAKTLDDVAQSRAQREAIERLFGGEIPESILRYNTADRAMDLLVEEQGRNYTDTGWGKDKQLVTNKDAREYDLFMLSGAGARWGALSRFPQNVGRALLRLYTVPAQTVVDPFAGHNSRMELCYRERRNYIGCDISKKFMRANFELRERLLTQQEDTLFPSLNKATIELHECDSRKMPVKNNAGDFTITSPPYWCLEDYGDEMGQLGKNDYPNFLKGLGEVARENFRCVKSGSFIVWCVNDFRYEGKFYAYHMHTAQLLRDAGFKQHDIAIIDLGTSMRASFASQIISQKILPKRHEYALIFVKP
jgi:DNA modification methylase